MSVAAHKDWVGNPQVVQMEVGTEVVSWRGNVTKLILGPDETSWAPLHTGVSL